MKFFKRVDGQELSRKRVPRHIYLPHDEDEWLQKQVITECTSLSSLIRKSLKQYRLKVEREDSFGK